MRFFEKMQMSEDMGTIELTRWSVCVCVCMIICECACKCVCMCVCLCVMAAVYRQSSQGLTGKGFISRFTHMVVGRFSSL